MFHQVTNRNRFTRVQCGIQTLNKFMKIRLPLQTRQERLSKNLIENASNPLLRKLNKGRQTGEILVNEERMKELTIKDTSIFPLYFCFRIFYKNIYMFLS